MMHDTFAEPARAERRHGPNRRRTRVDALADIEGTLRPVTILDVSLRGMKIVVPVLVFPGTPVTVMVLKHELHSIVHWYRLGHAGLRLLDQLDARTLIALESAYDDLAEYR